VLAAIAASRGYEGLVVATFLAGLILVALGMLKLGRLLKYVPHPVIAGFTAGIAVIIFLGQFPDFLGLNVQSVRGAPELFVHMLSRLSEFNGHAVFLGGLSLSIVMATPFVTRKVPGSLLAILVTSILAYGWDWPVPRIESRYGVIPSAWPELQ